MKKIASLLLILSSLALTACGFIPAFTDTGGTDTVGRPSGSNPQSSGTAAPDGSTRPSSDPGGTDRPDINPPVTSAPGKTGPITDDYPEVPGGGNLSILSFHEKSGPLSAGQIADCVGHYLPDVFTVSDAPKSLLDTIAAGVDGYVLIGDPCSEGGDYQAIFYRESRIEAVKSATIWLTDTPAVQSKWASAEGYDICTYALLSDRNTGEQFALFQASLSSNPKARAQEIICLYAKYTCYKDYFPTLLVGDLATGDNSVLTAGGGLTRQSDDLYTVCMKEADVTEIKRGDYAASYGSLAFGETPYKLDLNKKLVALTFDDGPRVDSLEHAYTEAVLKTLADYGSKATFFLVGNRLASPDQAELVRQEFAAGHEIGNHTYDHTSYTKLSAEALIENLAKTDEKVRALTGGIPTMVYRAPGGNNSTTASLARPLINWSVDTEDWKSDATPDSVLALFKKQLYAGGIVLMHDLHKNSPDALADMLTWLAENGYQAVTVSELFEFSNIQTDSAHAYYSTTRVKAR